MDFKYFDYRDLWKAVLMKMVLDTKNEDEAINMMYAMIQIGKDKSK